MWRHLCKPHCVEQPEQRHPEAEWGWSELCFGRPETRETSAWRRRQDKTTAPQKARSHLSHSTTTKKCLIAFGEINSSQSETALCSAVLAQSCSDTIVSVIPWSAPGHWRLDGPSESAGCLAAREKKKKVADRTLTVVCPLGSSRQTRNRMLRRAACRWLLERRSRPPRTQKRHPDWSVLTCTQK